MQGCVVDTYVLLVDAQGAKDSAQDAGQHVRATAGEVGQRLREGADDAGQRAQATADDAAGRTKQAAGDAREAAANAGEQGEKGLVAVVAPWLLYRYCLCYQVPADGCAL